MQEVHEEENCRQHLVSKHDDGDEKWEFRIALTSTSFPKCFPLIQDMMQKFHILPLLFITLLITPAEFHVRTNTITHFSNTTTTTTSSTTTTTNASNGANGRRLLQAIGGTLLENTYHIRGSIASKNDLTVRKADTLQSCFMGFGFRKCEHVPIKEPYEEDSEAAIENFGPYRSDQPELPPYPFNWRSYIVVDQVYCLECCANTRLAYDFKETWNFVCDISDGGDVDLKLMEIMPLEFRFARRETIDDEGIVTCDLPHESETTALTGYHLKIWVTEMSEGSQYYRGVSKCEATSTEDAGDTAFDDRVVFKETITLIMNHGSGRHVPLLNIFCVGLLLMAALL